MTGASVKAEHLTKVRIPQVGPYENTLKPINNKPPMAIQAAAANNPGRVRKGSTTQPNRIIQEKPMVSHNGVSPRAAGSGNLMKRNTNSAVTPSNSNRIQSHKGPRPHDASGDRDRRSQGDLGDNGRGLRILHEIFDLGTNARRGINQFRDFPDNLQFGAKCRRTPTPAEGVSLSTLQRKHRDREHHTGHDGDFFNSFKCVPYPTTSCGGHTEIPVWNIWTLSS